MEIPLTEPRQPTLLPSMIAQAQVGNPGPPSISAPLLPLPSLKTPYEAALMEVNNPRNAGLVDDTLYSAIDHAEQVSIAEARNRALLEEQAAFEDQAAMETAAVNDALAELEYRQSMPGNYPPGYLY